VEKQYRNASNLNARIALHERFSTNSYGWTRWVFDQLELSSNAHVLEIGCGTGKLWAENLERIPEGWSATLTNASPGMLGEAERSLADSRRFRFRVADARKLPFDDGALDAVVSNHVLHHVPERLRAISEISRVLDHNGTFYAATGGGSHLREMDWMMQILNSAHPDDGLAQRIGAFSLENGADQLSPHFSDISLRLYEDALIVTEARPLVDYVLSTMTVHEAVASLSEDEIRTRVSRLTESLERELADRGAIRVTKDTGLFVARR